MGEESKQEQAKPEEVKPEERNEEKTEEKLEEPKPPAPLILYVDLHCVGCAKKIERSIMKIRGVERVVIDMGKNEVTIKGIVEPQAVRDKIMKKTKRKAKVLSPLPATEGEPMPEVVTSQVSGPVTVELNINMHCEACAEQLKKKILKMRGVQTAVTEFSSGKVMVTGTMDADKLVEYVYRRTKKQARIVPQPEPEPPAQENKESEEAKAEEKKEEKTEKKLEEEKAEKKLEEEKPADQEPKKIEEGNKKDEENTEEPKKEEENNGNAISIEEESMKRLVYYYHDQPLYMIERIPPPQLFSDENPNACCIS